MKIIILCVGRTDIPFVVDANDLYLNRLKHYNQTIFEIIPEQKKWKKLSPEQRKLEEGKAILEKIAMGDICYLLDEKGKEYSSMEFSGLLQKSLSSGSKRLIFIIGGAFGFSQDVYQEISKKLSLSRMTFSHQMIRTLLLEQIYRGFTILRNEPYHNE